LFINLQ